MRPQVLVVLLDGVRAGEVERGVGDRLEFRYEAAYLSLASARPLSLSMPLESQAHGDEAITPWLWGVLPDAPGVRRRWADDFGVSAESPFDLLATPVGHDCAGAVQFCIPSEWETLTNRRGGVEWLDEADVAELLRTLRDDPDAWTTPAMAQQFSLAGAQPKTALHHANGRWGIPHGRVPTTHILKPAVPGLYRSDLNEHVCLTAARHLGLPAAGTAMVRFGDEMAVAVQRFDRVHEGQRLARLHQEDLCQALGLPPTRRFQRDDGPGATEIVALLHEHVYADSVASAVAGFVDALAYNWIIGAPDAHAKNYSVFLGAAGPTLAPLYDVMSLLPYGSRPPLVRLAMAVGTRFESEEIGAADWALAADGMRVDPTATIERIIDLADRVPRAFAQAVEQPDVQGVDSAFARRMLRRVRTRAITFSNQLRSDMTTWPRPAPDLGVL